MHTAPGDGGEDADDFITQRLRARGLFGAEWSPWQELWLPGATVAQARAWVEAAFPGPLVALHHGRRGDVHFSGDEVAGTVVASEGRLRLSTYPHDGGFLHAVAQRAAEAGVAGLVLDQDAFYGTAPFVALTEYRPGEAPRTEWFDPLRGLAPDAERVRAFLETYLDERRPFLDWVLDGERDAFGLAAGSFVLTRKGEVLPAVRWVTVPDEPRPVPTPRVQVVRSVEALRERPVGPAEPAVTATSATAALLGLTLASLAVSVLGASLMGPQTWPDALVVTGVCAVLVGWMALLPLRWPSGQRVPWGWRLGWFGALPVLVPLAMFLSGGTR